MVEKSASNRSEHWNGVLEEALGEACGALSAGEHQDAERRAKAVSALAKAVRDTADLAEHMRGQAQEDNADALRAEVRQRLARLVDAHRAGADFSSAEE